MRSILLATAILATLALSGCSRGADSPRGFSLPAGDAQAGATAFVALRCTDCHSVGDIPQSDPETAAIAFPLGGKVAGVKTYADLVTSIINPSHRLSIRYPEAKSAVGAESRMRNYNEVMTVQQMIDLVTFLQPQYEVIVTTPTDYRMYYP